MKRVWPGSHQREYALSDHEEHELIDPVGDEPMVAGRHCLLDAQPAVSEEEQEERPLQLFREEVRRMNTKEKVTTLLF